MLPLVFKAANQYSVAVDSTVSLMISACPQGELEVLDMAAGNRLQIPLHDKRGWIVAIDPKGRWLASSTRGDFKLMSPPTGQVLGDLPSEQYLDLLHSLTNLRVVPSSTTETGYTFTLEDNLGWGHLPVMPD